MTNSTLIFILGPTSSGKSDVAAGLAKKLDGEVISCDSMQIYEDMKILSHHPGADLLAEVPHHLLGTVSPSVEYNAAQYVKDAEKVIEEVVSRGKTPIITGGTGLYAKSLIDGIFDAAPRDELFRDKLEAIARKEGKQHLHRRLKEVDPASAAKLHPNDLYRVIRALEVYETTGRSIQEKKSESEGISRKYDCRMFALKIPREMLYARINAAVEEMFKAGIVEEVKHLLKQKIGMTAGKALGIKEVSAFLEGKTNEAAAKEELKRNTRRYAKRQMTWLRRDARVIWIDADGSEEKIACDIAKELG